MDFLKLINSNIKHSWTRKQKDWSMAFRPSMGGGVKEEIRN